MIERWRFPSDFDRRSLSVLDTALSQVRAYRSWRAFDPGPGCPVDARYAALPALVKKNILDYFPGGLLPASQDLQAALASGEIDFIETSGTLGNRVPNIWNQRWWDDSEKASWKLNSHAGKVASGDHPEAILASTLNVGFKSDNADLPMEKRRLARFLYLNEKSNPRLWSSALMDRMVEEMALFRPAILEANPSFLAKLCRHIDANHKKVYQPGLIVFTYEYPTALHYRQIRRVFDGPIASSYGATELGYVLMQCEEGKFHQNSEFCRVDFQPLKPEHGGPSLGRLLVTTFANPWFYILRFDAGDLVRIDASGSCRCGRNSGMIFSAVEGRMANATLTCSGRLVTLRELDEALGSVSGIDEYQLEQTGDDRFSLHLASRRPDKRELGQEAATLLKEIYGNEAAVSILHDAAIETEMSGKYCAARRLAPLEIENYLDGRDLPLHNRRAGVL